MRTLVPLMVLVMLLTIVAYAGAQEGAICSPSDKMTICGFLQARYSGSDSTVEDFSLRQMYVNLMGKVNENAGFVLTLATFDPNPPGHASDDIVVFNLFGTYKFTDEWSVLLGQVPTFFGLEAWQSSSQRLALERAAICEKGRTGVAADLFGFYFAHPSDRGLWVKRTGTEGQPDVYVGMCNGQFADTDADSNKNVSLDVKWTRDWGMAGVSWLDGDLKWPNDATGTWNDRKAVDVYAKYLYRTWNLQGEWADGKMLGTDRDGWYLQVSRVVEGKNYIPFVKYEEFNNVAAGVTMAEYDAIHAGVALQLDDKNQITFQITDADVTNGSTTTDDFSFGASWQTSF